MIIEGTVIRKLGSNVNTDVIFPSEAVKERDPKKLGPYAFYKSEGGNVPSPFYRDAQSVKNPIIIAGYNFGSGSSREDAVYVLKYSGVSAIIAQSYADIFIRNAYNNGLAAITCKRVDLIDADKLRIDLDEGTIENLTKNERYLFVISQTKKRLIERGGVFPIMRDLLKKQLSEGE